MPTEKHQRFWMVWNPSGQMPRVRHASRILADREAARLAKLNPGLQFIVLKAVGGHMAPAAEPRPIKFVERERLAIDEIPF